MKRILQRKLCKNLRIICRPVFKFTRIKERLLLSLSSLLAWLEFLFRTISNAFSEAAFPSPLRGKFMNILKGHQYKFWSNMTDNIYFLHYDSSALLLVLELFYYFSLVIKCYYLLNHSTRLYFWFFIWHYTKNRITSSVADGIKFVWM